MGIIIQIKAILLATFLLFFVLLPAGFIAAPFPIRRRLKIICPAWEFCSRILMRYACHVKIHIEDARPEDFKTIPYKGLYVVNHQGYMDIPTLIHITQASPIMKKEILYVPIFGWLAWVSGAMPVSRASISSRRKVFDIAKQRILKHNLGLQVYPEGTRSKDGIPKPFEKIKKTLMVFAFNENLPVIPVSIYGTRGMLSRYGFIRPFRKVGLKAHDIMYPKDFSNADEFARAVWAKVIEGHDYLKDQLGPQIGKGSSV